MAFYTKIKNTAPFNLLFSIFCYFIFGGGEKMKLLVVISVDKPLRLPINYLHILQAIIYRSIGDAESMSSFFHDTGYLF